jgi:hypothetical protein
MEEERRRRPGIGQIVSGSVGDIGSVLRLVPDIANYLRSISFHVKHMDIEVGAMVSGVRDLNEEMREMRAEIHGLRALIIDLDERMKTVADAVERLEPHIADVNLAVRPLRRAGARFRGRPVEAPKELPEAAD